jgi:uncharacterized protein
MLEELKTNKKYWVYAGVIFVVALCIGLSFGCHDDREKGSDSSQNVIAISGHGEIQAVPDIANVSFTITKDAKTVKDAQAGVAVIEKKALDLLKTKGIVDKDIKTANASFYPKYEYRQAVCPPIPMGAGTAGVTSSPSSPYYCPSGKQVIIGYTASESITVKIRNTDNVGDIMQGLGTTGVSDLSGPNFTIDNEDGLKAQARKEAIDDAKLKAKVLAKDLGIRLGKMTSFNEGGNYPMPVYDKMMTAGASESSAPAILPVGENTISSDVTITYEIR